MLLYPLPRECFPFRSLIDTETAVSQLKFLHFNLSNNFKASNKFENIIALSFIQCGKSVTDNLTTVKNKTIMLSNKR